MPGISFFRKPPGVLGRNNPRVHAFKKLRSLPDLAAWGFDNDPISLSYPLFLCGFGVNLDNGFPVKLPQPGNLAVFRMEKTWQSPSRDKDIRIIRV